MALTLEATRRIIDTALATGAEKGFKPLSVIVLDAGGNALGFLRSDGASPGRFQIAHGKAYGAVMLGMGGQAQMARAEAQAYLRRRGDRGGGADRRALGAGGFFSGADRTM